MCKDTCLNNNYCSFYFPCTEPWKLKLKKIPVFTHLCSITSYYMLQNSLSTHISVWELAINTPIHTYYCFLTYLKLCAVFYMWSHCIQWKGYIRFLVYVMTQARAELLKKGTSWLYHIANSYVVCCPLPPLGFFSTPIPSKHLSPAQYLHFTLLFQQMYQIPFARLNPILWFPVHISNLSSLLFISSLSVLTGVGSTSQF